MLTRRLTTPVKIGSVTMGGGAPIVVQSMTNTDTADVESTAKQCFELYTAGSEIVRLTVDTPNAAKAIPHIHDKLVQMGWHEPLLVGDFHYIGHTLLKEHPECAARLAKYRINPGNVGFKSKHDLNFATMIEIAARNDKPVRIGVNWGSLDQEMLAYMMDENLKRAVPLSNTQIMHNALIESALSSAARAQEIGLKKDKIVLSCKVSQVQDLITIYRRLSKESDYSLHLGLTEAGLDSKGIIATTAAFSVLLQEGIGDTIRASLTPPPGGDRTLEVRVCQEILQSMGLRAFMPMVTSCPGCGRTTSTVFQSLAADIQNYLRKNMPIWKQNYPNAKIEELNIAVMGCVVNGPGESKHAHVGISLPGTGEAPAAPVFIDGVKFKTLRGNNLAQEFMEIVENYIQNRARLSEMA